MIASVAETYELVEAAEIVHVNGFGCLAEPLEVVEFLGFVELAAFGELIHVAEKSVGSMESLKSLKSSTSMTLRSSLALCYPFGVRRTHQRPSICLLI